MPLKNESFDEFAAALLHKLKDEEIARVDGLGTFRKKAGGFEFIPSADENKSFESVETEKSKPLSPETEKKPDWLKNSNSDSKGMSDLKRELSSVGIPSGRIQAEVLRQRHEKYLEQKITAKTTESGFTGMNKTVGLGLLACCLLLFMFSPTTRSWFSSDEASAPKTETRQSATAVKVVSPPEISTGVDENSSSESDETGIQEVEASSNDNLIDNIEKEGSAKEIENKEENLVQDQVLSGLSPVLPEDLNLNTSSNAEASASTEEKADSDSEVKTTPKSELKSPSQVGGQHAIVAGSMQSLSSAKKLQAELSEKKFQTEIVSSKVNGQIFYRVVLGRFQSFKEAKEAHVALGSSYWVTRLSFSDELLSI